MPRNHGFPHSWSRFFWPATCRQDADAAVADRARCRSTSSASCRSHIRAASNRYDTLARNTLQFLSGRQEVIGKRSRLVANSSAKKNHSRRFIWLLDTISGTRRATIRVFRIDNLDVLDTLGLKPRQAFRYSLNESMPSPGDWKAEIELADVDRKTNAAVSQCGARD